MAGDCDGMRELFVIRSDHFLPNKFVRRWSQAEGEEVSRINFFLISLVRDLLVREKIEKVFSDGITEKAAQVRNLTLDGVRGVSYCPHSPDARAQIDWIEALVWARLHGLQTEFAPTDVRTPWLAPAVMLDALIKSAPFAPELILAAFWRLLPVFKEVRAEHLGYLRSRCVDAFGPLVQLHTWNRDKAVHKNLLKHGADKNLLWVGSLHKLGSVFSVNSGFKVVGIQIENDLSWSVETANSAMVPDYLPDLLEVSAQKAKAFNPRWENWDLEVRDDVEKYAFFSVKLD